jgi:hypothetical protein
MFDKADSIRKLEQRRQFANEQMSRALEATRSQHEGFQWKDYEAAKLDLLTAERALAAAKNEEHAIPVDFPVAWDIGAPLPHLLQNDNRAFLAFFVRDNDPHWDGTSVTVRDPASATRPAIAVVEFLGCCSARLGDPNDEVFEGHRLNGRGLDAYTAQEVVNSSWIAELDRINRVHDRYDASRWKKLHHYIFWFHDSTFECVAQSFQVEVVDVRLAEVLANVCKRLIA